MSFYQGDQYSFIFKIEVGGNPLNMEGIEIIEFTIGNLSKRWPLQVTYDEDKKYSISQLLKRKHSNSINMNITKHVLNISTVMFTVLLLIRST